MLPIHSPASLARRRAISATVTVPFEPDVELRPESDASAAAAAAGARSDRRFILLNRLRRSPGRHRMREWRYHETAILASDLVMLVAGGAAAMIVGAVAFRLTLLFAVLSFVALAISGSYR